jgi:hypothetical protein
MELEYVKRMWSVLPFELKLLEGLQRLTLGRGLIGQFQVCSHCLAIFVTDEAQAAVDEMDHAGLDDGLREVSLDRLGQPFEAIATDDTIF